MTIRAIILTTMSRVSSTMAISNRHRTPPRKMIWNSPKTKQLIATVFDFICSAVVWGNRRMVEKNGANIMRSSGSGEKKQLKRNQRVKKKTFVFYGIMFQKRSHSSERHPQFLIRSPWLLIHKRLMSGRKWAMVMWSLHDSFICRLSSDLYGTFLLRSTS